MPKRTDITSILVIGATMSLSACAETGNNIAADETAKQCTERFAAYANDPLVKQGFAGKPLSATYSYDVTHLSAADLKALMRLHDAAEKAPKGTLVSGPSQDALKAFMAEKVEPRGAIFMGNLSVFRTVQQVESVDQIVLTGCKHQQPGMRLIQIDTALAEVTDL